MLRFFLFFILFLFSACDYTNNNTNTSSNDNVTNDIQTIKKQDKNSSDDNITIPLQKELKQNLKKHLDALSKELQDKRIDGLTENQGIKNHTQHFESLYNRKDLPRDSNSVNLQQKFDKAFNLQEEQLKKLQQNTNEIMK